MAIEWFAFSLIGGGAMLGIAALLIRDWWRRLDNKWLKSRLARYGLMGAAAIITGAALVSIATITGTSVVMHSV